MVGASIADFLPSHKRDLLFSASLKCDRGLSRPRIQTACPGADLKPTAHYDIDWCTAFRSDLSPSSWAAVIRGWPEPKQEVGTKTAHRCVESKAVFGFWELHVGHAIDRRTRRAAWGAVVRYVDEVTIAIATPSGVVPNTCIDGRLDHRHFPLTAEASVLWACDAVMQLGTHGIREVTWGGTPVTIYTDVKEVWSFFHGKTPFSRHKVISELHNNLEFSCGARRVGDVLRLSRHRTKAQGETWVRDVKLVAPEQNERARHVAAAALKLWRPIEHNFHDE